MGVGSPSVSVAPGDGRSVMPAGLFLVAETRVLFDELFDKPSIHRYPVVAASSAPVQQIKWSRDRRKRWIAVVLLSGAS